MPSSADTLDGALDAALRSDSDDVDDTAAAPSWSPPKPPAARATPDRAPQLPGLATLPPELLFCVLRPLSAADVCCAGRACTALSLAATDARLWSLLHAARWPGPAQPAARGARRAYVARDGEELARAAAEPLATLFEMQVRARRAEAPPQRASADEGDDGAAAGSEWLPRQQLQPGAPRGAAAAAASPPTPAAEAQRRRWAAARAAGHACSRAGCAFRLRAARPGSAAAAGAVAVCAASGLEHRCDDDDDDDGGAGASVSGSAAAAPGRTRQPPCATEVLDARTGERTLLCGLTGRVLHTAFDGAARPLPADGGGCEDGPGGCGGAGAEGADDGEGRDDALGGFLGAAYAAGYACETEGELRAAQWGGAPPQPRRRRRSRSRRPGADN